MAAIELRPYQAEAVEALRAGIRAGHRSQLLYLATGAGKSVIAAHLMSEAYRKGSRAAFVVDRTVLVDQFSAHLDAWGIPHGVLMAGHWRFRPHERIQVASAQTLEARESFPAMDLLIADEAHVVRKSVASIIQGRETLRVLGLTATPFTRGLGALYSNIVNVRTTDELIAEGSLVPIKTYAAVAPDMRGAKVVAGEWSERDITERGAKIVGDIVTEWSAKTALHFGGPVKTFVFSASVEHGTELCRAFNAAGHRFEQISYKDGNAERRRALMDEFRKPRSEIVGLVSCEALARGTDVPDVLCGIGARPYRKSLSAHIQSVGRVMRPAPGKDFALWNCHSGNAIRFAADVERVFGEGVDSLDNDLDSRARAEPSAKEVAERKCPSCGYVMQPGMMACPGCGYERRRRSLVENLPGRMVALGATRSPPAQPTAPAGAAQKEFLSDRARVWRQLAHLAIARKGGDMAAAQRFAQAQYRNIYGDFARGRVETTTTEPASIELQKLVRHNIIRWAKGLSAA